MIIVITKKGDAHGAHMVELLKIKCEDVIVFDYSQFPLNSQITFYSSGSRDAALIRFSDGRTISLDKIKSVLNRRQDEPKPPDGIQDERIKEYIVRESRNFLDALPQILKCFWLSNPDAVRIASRKPYQIMVARQIGFSVPPTLITNSPTEAGNFVREIQKDIAVKALWTPGITVLRDGEEKGISFYTRRFRSKDIASMLQNIQNCPLIFQPYIEKAFELRITVVGNKVFACAIYSQQSEKTREDWRRYDLANTPHKQHQLPVAIQKKCILLVKELGLVFGAIDMIVTPTGEYIFLEINPNGQWLWIEHLTGMPISDAIAETLANPPSK